MGLTSLDDGRDYEALVETIGEQSDRSVRHTAARTGYVRREMQRGNTTVASDDGDDRAQPLEPLDPFDRIGEYDAFHVNEYRQ